MSGKSYKVAVPQGLYVALCSAMLLFIMATPALAESLLTHHVRQAVVSGQAQFLRPLPATQTLQIGILLPLRDQAGMDKFLQDLYDPASSSYRHFLSVAESTARFGPTQEDYDAVVAFAKANGMTVTNLAPDRLLLDVTASVAAIENAFHVKMGVYQHPTENRTFFAPGREPTVDLNVPLWHIGGLDNYSIPRPLYTKAAPGAISNTSGSGPGGNFLGSDRRAAYYGGTALTGAGQSVGLFQLDGYDLTDVQNYFTNVGQELNVPINNVLVDGASAGSDGDDTEQAIDIIEAVSMAPGLSQVLVYIGPRGSFSSGTTDTDIFHQMEYDDTAKQISCSWAWAPPDWSSNDGIFQLMASHGQNLFVASGDDGSYPNSSGFYYPAEDANVTAVGGTDLATNGAGGSWASETAWADSGGGCSPDGIGIPLYQQLPGVINSSNGGCTTLRNVPDVAAEANNDNYYCANGSCGEGLGGTSLAAPTWAGFLALANQQEEANHNTSLGFLNNLVYPLAGPEPYFEINLYDITSGTNGAYSAVVGYDLVTGWGSPNGCNLIATLTGGSCPPPAASVSPTSLSFLSKYDDPVTDTTILTNNGPGTLEITYMQVTGDSSFSLTYTSCGIYLGQGDSCLIKVTFAPQGCLVNPTGQLFISDYSTTGAQTVSLTGKTVACTLIRHSGQP